MGEIDGSEDLLEHGGSGKARAGPKAASILAQSKAARAGNQPPGGVFSRASRRSRSPAISASFGGGMAAKGGGRATSISSRAKRAGSNPFGSPPPTRADEFAAAHG